MNNKPFDPTKPYQCRNGWKAEIIYNKLNSALGDKLVAIIFNPIGDSEVKAFQLSGRYWKDTASVYDLINIPEKKILDVWVMCWKSGSKALYIEKPNITNWLTKNEVAEVLHIVQEYTEGEGL